MGGALRCLALLVAFGTAPVMLSQSRPTPELLQYIKDARKLGFKDAEIKVHAVKAGWPPEAVDGALRPTGGTAAKGPPAGAAGTPATAAPATPQKPVEKPQPMPQKAAQKPAELLQYVQEARKLGLNNAEIRANAMQAGWPAPLVDEAVSGLTASGQEPSAAPGAPEIPKQHGVPEDYQIGAGDMLEIRVWKEPDASVPAVVVRPDGKIAIPLLKDVPVLGLTPVQAERIISTGLSEYIQNANVTVVVTAIRSKKIYIVGAVKKEGPVALNYRMSVLQALSEAGGLTDYAKRKKIYVLRTESGKQYRLPFNYEAVIRGEQMEQNIWVAPDDTIVVPY